MRHAVEELSMLNDLDIENSSPHDPTISCPETGLSIRRFVVSKSQSRRGDNGKYDCSARNQTPIYQHVVGLCVQ